MSEVKFTLPTIDSTFIASQATRAVLEFTVPFVAQLGFGVGLGVSAKRSALIAGSAIATDLGVYAARHFTGYQLNENAEIGAQFLSPFITGGIYAGVQEFANLNSQGPFKNFTLATVTTAAAHGLARPSVAAMAMLLTQVRSEKRAEDL